MQKAKIINIFICFISLAIKAEYQELFEESDISVIGTRAPCPTPGSLTPVPGSPFTAGDNPFSVAYAPSGNFAAVANFAGNTVNVYSVNSITGTFTSVGSPFPTGLTPTSVAYSPNGLFAAVTNADSENISVYSVNPLTGAFTSVGSPFPTANGPISVAYSPNGNFAAVANFTVSKVSVYSVNPTTGAFTPISGSPFATGNNPRSVAYSPNGSFAAVANQGTGNVSVYSVNPITGAFNSIQTINAGTDPFLVAYSPNGNFAAVANQTSNNVNVYSVNPVTGTFTQIQTIVTGTAAVSVAYSPNGSFAAVGNNFSSNISVYSVNPTTGIFTPIVGSPFTSVGNGSIAYSPNSKFLAVTNNGLTRVSVFNTNIGAIAQPTSITTACNTPIAFTPSECGLNITIFAAGPASHGTVSFSDNTITYTPTAGFSGLDSFPYTIQDNIGDTSSSTVSVTVTTPGASITNQTTTCNTPITFTPNDCGSGPNVIAAGPASHGTVSFSGNTITYTPTAGFSGIDSFPYTVQDSTSNTRSSTVNMTVTPVAQPISETTTCDTPVTFDIAACGSNVVITSVTMPTNGAASFLDNSITYTPNAEFIGTDSFSYTVSDSAGNTSTATVNITITSIAPVAPNITVTTKENTPITIGVVQGPCTASTKVVSITNPAHGTAVATPDLKSIVYTPNTGFTGVDSFNYTLGDPATGTITVNVIPTVIPPVPVLRSALSSVIINKYCPAG